MINVLIELVECHITSKQKCLVRIRVYEIWKTFHLRLSSVIMICVLRSGSYQGLWDFINILLEVIECHNDILISVWFVSEFMRFEKFKLRRRIGLSCLHETLSLQIFRSQHFVRRFCKKNSSLPRCSIFNVNQRW